MKIRKTLFAEDGKWLTNGKGYWKQFTLPEGESELFFYEISEEQYEQIEAEIARQSENPQ